MFPVHGSQQMNSLSWSQSFITCLNILNVTKFCQKFDDNLRAATGVVGIPSISGGITFVIIVAVIAVLAVIAVALVRIWRLAHLSRDLLGTYMAARTLKVRVLVDASLVKMRPDWIDYVQRVVSVTSANLRALVGVELSLYGVGRVEGVVAAGAGGLTTAKEAPLEGAELLLVFTAEATDSAKGGAIPGHAAGAALVVDPSERKIGTRAVVVASPKEGLPHTRSMLHEVAHLLGAEDIIFSQ